MCDYSFGKDDHDRHDSREPEFSEMFMSYLLTRNSRIEEDLIDQLFNSSENASPGCCFSLQISARKAGQNRSWENSVRKCWRI